MKTKYGVVFVQIFSFLFFTQVYSQSERFSEIGKMQRHDQIQKEDNVLLINSTSLDSFITATMSEYHIPGLSACILKDGELVWNHAYGYADVERQIPVIDSTIFAIASISKTITGTALMQLYERGIFELGDNVKDYLPTDLQVVNPSYPNDPITFKMILSHVSSIIDNWDILDTLVVEGDSPISLYDGLKNYLVSGGAYYSEINYDSLSPASKYSYCNIATALLGYIVEAITDTTFEEYCYKHIFEPLNMNETSWFLSNLDTNHVARPSTWTLKGYQSYPHWGHPFYPCGSLRTSSLQLAHFLNMFMQKGTLENSKILDNSTVALMTTIHYPEIPVEQGYPDSSQGLIWYQEYFNDRLVWGHSGGSNGITTTMYYYEPDNSGVIVLTNGDLFLYPSPCKGVSEIVNTLFDFAVSCSTVIAVHDENVLSVFALKQNFPNPFNSITNIEFALSHSGFVTLKIYTMLGEEVTTLVSENLSAGKYKYLWDAMGLASGVYFYRLHAGEYKQTKKLILMK